MAICRLAQYYKEPTTFPLSISGPGLLLLNIQNKYYFINWNPKHEHICNERMRIIDTISQVIWFQMHQREQES